MPATPNQADTLLASLALSADSLASGSVTDARHWPVSLLGSLAFSAGALAVAPAAHAAIVVQTLNHDLGFSGGSSFGGSFGVTLAGVPQALVFSTFHNTGLNVYGVGTYSSNAYINMKIIKTPVTTTGGAANVWSPVIGAKGQKWGDITAAGSVVDTYASLLLQDVATGTEYGPFPSGEQYYAFTFQAYSSSNPTPVLYGWYSATLHDSGAGSARVHLDQIAYDDTGAQLPLGDTGAPVPEPASLGLLALGAMVTGAVGTRRFKRARAAA